MEKKDYRNLKHMPFIAHIHDSPTKRKLLYCIPKAEVALKSEDTILNSNAILLLRFRSLDNHLRS